MGACARRVSVAAGFEQSASLRTECRHLPQPAVVMRLAPPSAQSLVLVKALHPQICPAIPVTALVQLLNTFRTTAQTEREKGTYFERLVKTYLQQEPSYQDLFGGQVYLWEEWRKHCVQQGQPDPGVDAGIDLVAVEATKDNPRIFAVQAKFYAEDAKLSKAAGIDSFLSAMGKAPFTNGLFGADHVQSHRARYQPGAGARQAGQHHLPERPGSQPD